MTKGEVESLRPHPRAPIYLDINQSTTTHYQTHSILTSQVKTYQQKPDFGACVGMWRARDLHHVHRG